MNNEKKYRIILYILIGILVISVGVCAYLVVVDIAERKDNKNKIGLQGVSAECTKTVNSLDEVKPMDNCLITDLTVNNVMIGEANNKLNTVFIKGKDDIFTVSLKLNNKDVSSPVFNNSALNFYTSDFHVFNDKVLIILNDTGDQMGTKNVVVVNNNGEAILSERNVHVDENEDGTITIHKYNFLDTMCSEENYIDRVVQIAYKYEIVDNKVNMIENHSITCREYREV